MDRQIRRAGLATVALFLILFGQLSYLQVFAADRIADNPANAKRQLIAEYRVDRGEILAADRRTVLALSRRSRGELVYQRRYPQGPRYAGITGFYSIVYGRTELEAAYDDYLSGDAPELLPSTLGDLILGRPKRGASIVTTIQPDVQEAAEAALGDLPGGVAAIDPRTGDLLALVSNPTYDPNALASQDPREVRRAWEELNDDPERPMRSRATDELYPPGSTFKIVTAAAALAAGFGPESRWPNPPELDLPLTTNTLQNFGGEHCLGGASSITLAQALQVSCNVTFGEIALRLGAEALARQARAFGFAPEPGAGEVPFDIPFEEGVFPDPSAFEGNDPLVAFAGIGQFDVAANPLQMALAAAAIGNGGTMMRPRLVTEIRDPQGRVIRTFEPEPWRRSLSGEAAAALTRMMVGVVEAGTGTAARIPGVAVAGKTGTAQHGEGEPPHAWFVAFAPAEDPRVAVAVVVLNGGSLGDEATGGRLAAPIARAVIEAALG